MKKAISLLLLLTLLSSFCVPASAVAFQRSNQWFCTSCGNVGTGKTCSSCCFSRPSGLEGSIVTFGSMEQNSRGKQPIEWIVIDTEGDNALLLSRYILDCMLYNISSDNVTWETSSIRFWLNSSFLNNAFQTSERNRIQRIRVDNSHRQAKDSFVSEKNTVDSIFLLSCTEAYQYLGVVWNNGEDTITNSAAAARLTDYARKHSDMYSFLEAESGTWWLRSMHTSNAAFTVGGNIGDMYYTDVSCMQYGVRPAMWVRTK